MKIINKTILATSLLMVSGLTTAAEPFNISANMALTTDYVFRGFTQTSEDPAIQGGLDVAHASGLYAGIWASNVNFGDSDPAHIEIDYTVGFGNQFSNGVNYDLAYIYYTYPGADDNLNYDLAEIKLGLGYQMLSAEYYYSNDFFGGIGKAHYFTVAADFDLGNGFSAGIHAGRQSFDDDAVADYTDYGLSLGKTLAGVDFSLDYTDTDLDNVDDVADGRVFLTASKSF